MSAAAVLYADPEVIWHRALQRVRVDANGCWMWTGAKNSKGYGCISSGRKGRTVLVHRLAIIVRDGSIPPRRVADHTCHDPRRCVAGPECPHRACCNQDHLDVVTVAENSRRGAQQNRTTCKRGHLLDIRMRGGRAVRFCRLCETTSRIARRARARVSA